MRVIEASNCGSRIPVISDGVTMVTMFIEHYPVRALSPQQLKDTDTNSGRMTGCHYGMVEEMLWGGGANAAVSAVSLCTLQ